MLTVEQFVAASLLKHNLSQWHKIWGGNNWLFLFQEFPLNVQVNTYITKRLSSLVEVSRIVVFRVSITGIL